jgi:hypothetical protein
MTDQEKKDNSKFCVQGGYLKSYEFKDAFKNMWEKLTKEQRGKIKEMPNFNKKIFKEITGVTIK